MLKTAAARILLQFAHPFPHRSITNNRLLEGVRDLPGLVVNDLYEHYPDFHIDSLREQQLLQDTDLLVVQHPLYWYSAPALFKQWQDSVLEYGFAFGTGGDALRGKDWLSVITAGQSAEAYRDDGHNGHRIQELVYPFACAANHCGMGYLEPIVVYGAHRLTDEELDRWVAIYRNRLEAYRPSGRINRG